MAALEERMRQIRAYAAENQGRLLDRAMSSLSANGCRVAVATSAGDALAFVARVTAGCQSAVLSRAPAAEEIGVAGFLAGQGVRVWRSSPGEWLSCAGQDGVIPGPPEGVITAPARKTVQACLASDLGITGADAIAVETGTIFLAEEEGDARLVSNLPYVHLVVTGVECLVPDLAAAVATIRYLSRHVYGRPLVRYISAISGPSRTGDIEMQLVPGMHGPKEVAVLLLDRPL